MTVPDPATGANPLGSKPKKWAHGGEVPTVTLADGTIAEAVAAIGYVWSAVAGAFVLATVPTYQSASFSVSSTTTAVVGAVSAKRIKVFAIVVSVDTDGTTVVWKDDTTALNGSEPFLAKGGYTLAVPPPAFLLATSAGKALNLTTTGGVASGFISYWADDAT